VAEPGPLLAETLRSVRGQTYAHWELCLAVAPAREPAVRRLLRRLAPADARVHVRPCPERGGLTDAWNTALDTACGDFVALLRPGDTLAPFALFEVARAVGQDADLDFLYSDEDSLDDRGRRREPLFKPGWSPDTLRCHNYVGDLLVLRRALLRRAGRFRPGFDGDGGLDLVLRASEQARRIVHLPRVLYHRRCQAGTPTGEVCRRAVADHLRRLNVPADVEPGLLPWTCRVAYRLPARPLVSVIIPNRDEAGLLERCVASVRRSRYSPFEVLVVENGSRLVETFACYRKLERQPGLRVLTWDRPFNYSAINNFAVARAAGEVLLFLNNDVEALGPDWVERLLEHALRPEVGAAGAKLYFPDDTVQHAGVVVNYFPVHHQVGLPRDSAGYHDRLVTVQNQSAVTAACLMTRRAVFDEVGGFDEKFPVAFNDVDLCLKMRRRGYLVVWTPHAELYHHESATRGPSRTLEQLARAQAEVTLFGWKWGPVLSAGDPYHNPNLNPQYRDTFSPA
jgi:GT2 family glycosyltransferase